MKEDSKQSNSKIGLIIGLIVVGVVIWFFLGRSRSNSWTLFIYSSASPDQSSIKDRVENINSQEACIQSGLAYTSSGGSYECAYACKYKTEYQTEICERTCDHGGCRE